MGPLPVALRPAWSGSSLPRLRGRLHWCSARWASCSGRSAGCRARPRSSRGRRSSSRSSWRLAVAASRNGRPVVAGLCAFVAVAVVAVVAGSLLDAVGLAGRRVAVRPGFRAGAAARRDRRPRRRALRGPQAPLPAAAARGDRRARLCSCSTPSPVSSARATGSPGRRSCSDSASSRAAATLRGDRSPWAFWKHVAAAILIGAAVVWLLDGSGVGWVLIGVVSLAYLGAGALDGPLGLGRRRRARAAARHHVFRRRGRCGHRAGAGRFPSRPRTAVSSSGRRRSSTPASASSTSCSGGCSASRRCTAASRARPVGTLEWHR